jgi:aspartyl protease family protein
VAGVALALVVAPGPAAGQLYRWSDGRGTTYYTGDLAAVPPRYRDQAVDIGAPTPASPPAAEPAARGISIPYTGGPLVVHASLNGVPLRLLVDTGADRTLISPAAMARAGIDLGAGIPAQIRGVTGEAAAMLVTVPRLDVGGIQVGPVGVIVHTLATAGVDGLLGRDVLDAFTVSVDAAAGRALLTPR